MAKQEKYDLKGLRIIAAAYVVMALTLFGLQLSRVFIVNQWIELGKIGLFGLWWLLILVGCIKLSSLSGEYVKALIASLLGLVFTAGEAFMLWRNLQAGMGETAYTDVYVMFMYVMGMCCLLYTMTKVLKAIGPMVERFAIADEDKKSYNHTWFLVALLVLLSMAVVPICGMFPKTVWFIGTMVAGAIAMFAQWYVAKLLLDTYNACQGKPVPRKEKSLPDETRVMDKETLTKEMEKETAAAKRRSRRAKNAKASEKKSEKKGE